MITRCPQCRTAFRVSQAQLEARAGQVRCGACTHVFDGASYLVENSAVEIAHRTQLATEPPPVIPAESPQWQRAAFRPVAVEATERVDDTLFDAVPVKPSHRLAWLAGSVVLALALMVQAVYHFRGELAIQLPEVRPLLTNWCARLGCVLPLPRHAELMSIEASDLQADGVNPNVMLLTATLRNRATFAQTYPALELTLTDNQDLPLARRVLFPADYLGAAPAPEAGFAAGSESTFKVTLQLAVLKAAGYRLYLFYP